MSFDLHLATTCDHLVFRELALMESDRRTIRLDKPLAAASLSLYATGNPLPKSVYSIVYDPVSVDPNQLRMIYFNQRWQSPNDYFEVTYRTYKQYCAKCSGLGALDDISFTVKGALREARDERLLLQNLEKWTITEIRSNPFHSFVGTSLVSLLGERITDLAFLNSKIIQEINTTLSKYSDLQDQYKLTGRPMTDGETLQSVDNIEVVQDENDPTILHVTVTVKAASGKSVDYEQYLKVA